MKFISPEHRHFCEECLAHSKSKDCYHQALFYTLGICPDTRTHVHDIFDFNKDRIKLDVFEREWQTSGSHKVCLMAFNLWNGYDNGRETTPENLFNSDYAPYFYGATLIRFEHDSLIKSNPDKGMCK